MDRRDGIIEEGVTFPEHHQNTSRYGFNKEEYDLSRLLLLRDLLMSKRFWGKCCKRDGV